MLVLTEPSAQNPVRSVLCRKASVRADTSIGSPSLVAVPCASIRPMVPGVDLRLGLRGEDDLGLSGGARGAEADLAAAVVVDGAAADDGADAVAVGEGVLQPLEDDGSHSVAGGGAGGVRGEGPAVPVG